MTQVVDPTLTRRERQREATYAEIVTRVARAARRGRRAVPARGRGPDGHDRAGALPLRRELSGPRRPGRLRDRQVRDRDLRRRRRRDRRRRPGRAGWWLRSPSSGCGRWPTRASSRSSSPTRSPTPAACATSCSPRRRSGLLMTDLILEVWQRHRVPGARRSRTSRRACASRSRSRSSRPRSSGPRGAPRPGLGLHAGLDPALRRRRPRGDGPHGPARHRERRDVRRRRPPLRPDHAGSTTTCRGWRRSSARGWPGSARRQCMRSARTSSTQAGTSSPAGPWRDSWKNDVPSLGCRLSSRVRAPWRAAYCTKPAAG